MSSLGEDEVPHPEPPYLSYGIAALNRRYPVLMSGVAAVPSFTAMWPLMGGLDYFGIFDGLFHADSAKHLVKSVHVAIAKEIESELNAKAPRFLEAGNDLGNWWRTVIRDAFRVAEDELVARVQGSVAFDAPAFVALVLKDYLVVASRGATRAVLYRGKLTSQHRSEPCKGEREKRDVQSDGKHVVGSIGKLEEDMKFSNEHIGEHVVGSIGNSSGSTSFRHYFPEPEVLLVKRNPRDKFLILATGSVWDIMSPAAACSFIKMRLMSPINMPWQRAIDGRGSPTLLAKELAEKVIHSGCKGNVVITIILFQNFWNKHRDGTSTK